MDIGRRIKEAMGEMPQDVLARKTGLSQSSICRIINNQTNPTIKTLKLLAEALNIPIEFLCIENDKKSKVSLYLKDMTDKEVEDLLKHLHKEELYRKVISSKG